MVPLDSVRLTVLAEKALEEYMGELLDVYQQAYRKLPEYGYQHPERIRGYIVWLWRGDPEGFLVAFSREKILGFISVHGAWQEERETIGEIHEFVVHPAYQGRGVGGMLFDAAIQYLMERGRKKIGLWVGEKNERALEFYLRRGFVRKGQWGKWIRMMKEVKPPDAG